MKRHRTWHVTSFSSLILKKCPYCFLRPSPCSWPTFASLFFSSSPLFLVSSASVFSFSDDKDCCCFFWKGIISLSCFSLSSLPFTANLLERIVNVHGIHFFSSHRPLEPLQIDFCLHQANGPFSLRLQGTHSLLSQLSALNLSRFNSQRMGELSLTLFPCLHSTPSHFISYLTTPTLSHSSPVLIFSLSFHTLTSLGKCMHPMSSTITPVQRTLNSRAFSP